MRKIVMSIAGSDSGGGAGVQADLKAFERIGVHGTFVITGITAQSPGEITGLETVSEQMIEDQFSILTRDLPPQAIKIGALFSSKIIQKLTPLLKSYKAKTSAPIIIDPVMVATSGHSLLKGSGNNESTEKILQDFYELADLITPNRPEAESLLGNKISIANEREISEAAVCLFEKFHSPMLIKGGHFDDNCDLVTDYFYDGKNLMRFELPYQPAGSLHGTGCTLSSCIAAYLAQGEELASAIKKSKLLTNHSIRDSYRMGEYMALNISPNRTDAISNQSQNSV